MDKPWKVICAFVGVFAAGAIFGGVFSLRASGQRLGSRPVRPQIAAQQQIGLAMMQQLTARLKLTEEQREKIRPVIARTAEELQRLRRENVQATKRTIDWMHRDITSLLSPEQRVELEQLKVTIQQRLNNQKKGNEGGRDVESGGRPGERGPRNPNSGKTAPAKAEPPI